MDQFTKVKGSIEIEAKEFQLTPFVFIMSSDLPSNSSSEISTNGNNQPLTAAGTTSSSSIPTRDDPLDQNDEYRIIKDKIFSSLYHRHGNANSWRRYMDCVRLFVFGSIAKAEMDGIILDLFGDEGQSTYLIILVMI